MAVGIGEEASSTNGIAKPPDSHVTLEGKASASSTAVVNFVTRLDGNGKEETAQLPTQRFLVCASTWRTPNHRRLF